MKDAEAIICPDDYTPKDHADAKERMQNAKPARYEENQLRHQSNFGENDPALGGNGGMRGARPWPYLARAGD